MVTIYMYSLNTWNLIHYCHQCMLPTGASHPCPQLPTMYISQCVMPPYIPLHAILFVHLLPLTCVTLNYTQCHSNAHIHVHYVYMSNTWSSCLVLTEYYICLCTKKNKYLHSKQSVKLQFQNVYITL